MKTTSTSLPKRLIQLAFVGLAILWLCHQCALLPTSRLAWRPFVLARDYEDMKRIFKVGELPKSFRLAKIKYPGVGLLPGPDGPPWIRYQAVVAPQDYAALVSNLETVLESDLKWTIRRFSAWDWFDPDMPELLWEVQYEPSQCKWRPDLFETSNTVHVKYTRPSYILVDTRTSSPLHLYITTRLPYDEPSSEDSP